MNRRAPDRPLASGRTPRTAGRLVGRDAELDVIRGLLERAREGRGQVLVVRGPPGIGKTALLSAAAELATGSTCVSAHGVETEAALGHAALLELLAPLRDRLGDVPPAQANALGAALGWEPVRTAADPFLVGAATMSLLAAVADRQPLLVLIDDVHWFDPESAAAVLFAVRRLARDPVVVLIAARSGAAVPVPIEDLPVLTLSGLSAAAAATLLDGGITEDVRDRLVRVTEGVPLALLDIVPRLSPAQRSGAAPLSEPLPVGRRLLDGYREALEGLTSDAWRTVLLAAVGPDALPGPVLGALTRDGVDTTAAVEESQERGVLVRDGGAVRFRHPLIRTAVLARATPAELRAAHLTMADALEGDDARPERTWHLALAAGGPDDELAEELAAVAEQSRRRWGPAAASRAAERAALLAGRADRAAEFLAAATEDAMVSGDVVRTQELGARVLSVPSSPAARARVLFATGVLEEYAGSVPRAAELLGEAAELAEGSRLTHVLAELALARFRLGDLPGIAECATRIDAAADRTDPAQRLFADFTTGLALMLRGDVSGREQLRWVVDQVASPQLGSEPRYLLLMALASGFLGDPRRALRHGIARLDDLRSHGVVGVLVPVLALSAAGRAMVGDQPGAFADAGEAAELGTQLGYVADTAVALEMVAWQSAARGRHDEAMRALDQARALTDRAGTTAVAAHQALTAAFCALSRGAPAEAIRVLEGRLEADGGVGAMGEPLGVAPLLVEAYVAVDRRDDAMALTRRYVDAMPQPATPLEAALAARCVGLTTADEDVAAAAFEEALAAHAADVDPFETARTRLLLGSRLRRSGRRVAARGPLAAAAAAFESMELTAWYRRAADELGATGATARSRRPRATEPLTSQETRVALLVATGCSNREVAASLFLSPKTVEHHLASVFRKRGFRSRTELAAAFAAPESHR